LIVSDKLIEFMDRPPWYVGWLRKCHLRERVQTEMTTSCGLSLSCSPGSMALRADVERSGTGLKAR
jgi:hypothetical protein